MIFSSDPELIEIGDRALKIIFLLFPLAGLQMVSSGMYQALGRTKPAFFISILRQFLVLIPAILILSRFFALDGIWFGFLVTEIISFIICFYFYKREMNLIKNRFELGDNVENVKVSV
jgi:Na+-driven multidrug efflux pump